MNIKVYVRGGVVQDVECDDPDATVEIIDYDDMEAEGDEEE